MFDVLVTVLAATLPAATTPAVPRRRLLTRWCPVSATVTQGRDAPGRRMVLPAPPHRADRLASPVPARRGRPDERQPHGSLRQPSPGRRGPGRARGRPTSQRCPDTAGPRTSKQTG